MFFPNADVKEMETKTEWMKHNSDPSQVQAAMKATVWYRRNFIRPIGTDADQVEKPDVGKVLEKFPHMFDTGMVSLTQ